MTRHIIFAHHLSGDQRGVTIAPDDIVAALRDPAPAWLHLQADAPESVSWIDEHLHYLDPAIRAALTEPETRPRAVKAGKGVLLFLRGINLNAGADPEDMVSLRIYADSAQIVSLSRRSLRTVDTLARRIEEGEGPETAGGLIADFIEELTSRIETQVTDLENRTEVLEAAVIEAPLAEHSSEVTDQRLELADLRRFLPAQRDAVKDMVRMDTDLLGTAQRVSIDEQQHQLVRVVETLDALREQLSAIRSEIDGARDERLNRNLYVLSVISAVFLPLGFMTGLMGINVAGMPGEHWPPAFWVFSFGMAVLGAGVLVILKFLRIL
ncbi:zinc transporter ZntB [Palleronia sp. LCG004]|uniref:zinc transporter ZntB n=1 Tax=Palleronia sp. LCG004 TaxID=3079304 RepID=UPI002942C3F6|nr:zinc transporter ZntB [Palleronia sp. LCG004]WOI56672.1 zinc transporter ZntB [Palleronia sp. LCG004]